MTQGLNPDVVAEAQEIVDALNSGLIEAEKEARAGEVRPDVINELFRGAHSLKGISGMFGLEELTGLAHALETVLDGMRLGKVRVDPETLDALYETVEGFAVLLGAAATGEKTDSKWLEGLLHNLTAVAEGGVAIETADVLQSCGLDADVLAVLTEYEEHRLRENLRIGRGLYLLRTRFDLSTFDVGLAELDETIKGIGEAVTKLPSSEATDPGAIAFDIIMGSDCTTDEIIDAIGDERVDVVQIKARAQTKDEGAPGPTGESALSDATDAGDGEAALGGALEEAQSVRSVSQTVRVDIRRLDRLMNLVGELGLIRMNLQGMTDSLRLQGGSSAASADLHKLNRAFERRLNELQGGIMEVRMVPLANLFERMQRIGRKAARELGREVRLEFAGETTELDKLIVEDLADPMMHLIRNAVDHGIESPDERLAAGKSREGTIKLSGQALGNHVVVTVEDDGCGLDVDRIRRVAIKRGVVSAEAAGEISDREFYNVIFQPGFSTNDAVTEYSGRGVGLDVVKNNISRLSGIIDVDSTPGEGMLITITLPITLAIIPALVVIIADRSFAIPLNNIMETLEIGTDSMTTIERREVITLRGATVPTVDLRDLFGLSGERPGTSFGVIAGAGETRMALLVDDLVGQQDIVIKALGKRLKARGIAGATELGNQDTVLVIDTVDLLNEMTGAGVTTEGATA